MTLSNNPERDTMLLYVPLYRPCTMSGKFVADKKPFVHLCPPAERAALDQGQGRMISRGGGLYARLILGVDVHDLTGGFKCIRRAVLETIVDAAFAGLS